MFIVHVFLQYPNRVWQFPKTQSFKSNGSWHEHVKRRHTGDIQNVGTLRCVCFSPALCAHIFYIKTAEIQTKLWPFTYFSVSIVTQQNKFAIQTETWAYNDYKIIIIMSMLDFVKEIVFFYLLRCSIKIYIAQLT